MAIRLLDAQSRLGRGAGNLADLSAAFVGSYVAAPNRTGVLSRKLADIVASLRGNYMGAINRTGSIAAAVGALTPNLRGTFAPATADVTPPTVPTSPVATTGSSTTINLSWNASTDSGSGMAGYNVYRSLTSGGTYGKINPSLVTGTSYGDTNLNPSTAYYYKVTAVDNATNESAQSVSATATTASASGNVVWNSGPDQTMYLSVPYSQDLDAYCTGSVYYAVISGTLPAGLTLNATTGVISGTPSAASSGAVTIRAFDNLAEGDFYGRSHAPGVTFFDGFESATDFANRYVPGPTGVRAALDSAVKKGAGSSLRFDVKAGEATARISGAYVLGTLGGSGFGQNTTFYVQHRLRLSANWETNFMNYWRNTATGMKVFIIHQGSSTNSDLEITFASYVTTQMAMNSGSVLFWTNLTDPFFVDGRYTYDRLDQSGWNLDAGGPPWSVEANSFHNGSQHFWDDEWITFYLKVHIGTLNGTHSLGGAPLDSTLEAWVKRESEGFYRKFCACKFGQSYTGSTSDAFNNMTLTPYMTGLATPAPTDSSMWLDELIISSQPIAMPLT